MLFDEVFLSTQGGLSYIWVTHQNRVVLKGMAKADHFQIGFICCVNGKTAKFDPLAKIENIECQMECSACLY